jgi:sucrose-phosphate synthase
MRIALLNPQGNFDPEDSYWTEHPDFGGQLVYVKQVALALGELGHQVDILTRQIIDPDWPEFSGAREAYPGAPNVRIIRLPAGPDKFLRKELLWPHLIKDWVPNIIEFYKNEGDAPDYYSAHYGDGGLCGVLLENLTGIPFSFTAHSLGAQKMDKLKVSSSNIQELEDYFFFRRRLIAERLSMNRSIVNITSTEQERYIQYSHNAYRGAVDWTDNNRFAVISPGVNLAIFDKNTRIVDEEGVKEYIDNKLARDLSPERVSYPCIVASSRLDPKKNHLGLVEAFASSPELRQKANLVIITGNLEDPLNGFDSAGLTEKIVLESLLAVIEKRNLRDQVSMFAIQGQRQLGAAYRYFSRKKSVFALTALYEPFGLAPLEAMASGMPAVVTKFGGPSESMLEDGQEFGILVDPTDLAEISTALFQLTSNPDLWNRIAEAGYLRVLSRYIWKRTAEGYVRILQGAQQNQKSSLKLQIHPYFLDPAPDNDLSIDELIRIYLEYEILGVGETLVDFIATRQSTSLRSAEEFQRFLGGQPANVAVYASKLGSRAAVLSKIGQDRFGEFLEEALQYHGVNTGSLLKTDQLPTSSVFVTKTTGVPDFQVNRGADSLLTIHDTSEELIRHSRAVHTTCFALSREPARSAVRRALRLAKKYGKLVSLDPNYNPRIWPDKAEAWEVLAQIMPYITIIKPSLDDARLLFDPNLDEEELETACLDRFHELGAEIVIVTRSGGMVTVSDGKSVECVGPLPLVEVDNVIGGSDAFWGGLLVAYLDGRPWKETVYFAHQIAALKLQNNGQVDHLIDKELIYNQINSDKPSEKM